jgi:hypothetical protein
MRVNINIISINLHIQVYGETVSDLLLHGKRCGHSKAASQQFVLSGAAEQAVGSIEVNTASLHDDS